METYEIADVENLLKEFAQTRSRKLRDELIEKNINLVKFLAGKFAWRGEPLEDLIQVGTIGLINAIDRFDPKRKTKFSTYATPTIVGEIKRHFRDKCWNFKVPRRYKEMYFEVLKTKEKLGQSLGSEPTIAQIAEAMDTAEEEVIKAIECGQTHERHSLETRVAGNELMGIITLNDFLIDPKHPILDTEEKIDIERALSSLSERHRAVLHYKFQEGLTQEQIAEKMDYSQMQISRLQKEAIYKLRTFFAQ